MFGTVLDRQSGHFRLGPFGTSVPTSRAYEPGTNVLVTTCYVANGWVVVRDALTLGPRLVEDTITPHTRPPFDDDADHVLVRTVECIEGSVDIDLVCEPVFDYGRVPPEWTLAGDGRHTADATGAGLTMRLHTDRLVGIEGDRVRARRLLREGEQLFCSLSWAEGLSSPADLDEAKARMAATTRFWRAWLARPRIPHPRCRAPIQRAALVMKGLTYMPTGATVARAD